MDKIKIIEYIENSFLSPLLKDDDITDISYNGVDFFYVSNSRGRAKSIISIDYQSAKDFLRQIANLCEQQFSYTNPILDVSVGRYRINAIHQSIGRVLDNDAVTFSIRIASNKPRINDDSDFFTLPVVELLKELIKNRQSIIIGGLTSSGKTELQKYLLRNMKTSERVVVIDNVMELESVREDGDIDLTCWRVDERNPYSSCAMLIKNALRNNPDWLILSEARDKEMLDVLNSAMTGSPIITTIHSQDIYSLPSRMARMILRNEQKLDYDEAIDDIYHHFHFYIYLKKEERDGRIKRYISDVCYIDEKGQASLLFTNSGDKPCYYKLPKDSWKHFRIKKLSPLFFKTFIGDNSHE